ncbi:MAG: chloride channel protein [Pseudomonadales bacterium]|nr:chloride channel protein [Pseudomonadales bacterium]
MFQEPEATNFVLIGMATMMAAVIRTPLAAIMIAVEISDQTSAIVPATIAIVPPGLAEFFLLRGEVVLRESMVEREAQREWVNLLGPTRSHPAPGAVQKAGPTCESGSFAKGRGGEA